MRIKARQVVTVLLALAAGMFPLQPVAADTGPKPTMTFTFTQAGTGPQLSITSGSMLECEQPDCSDGQALRQLGPQHFSCEASACDALGYGFSTYHKLSITFSDGKTRESNIFQTAGFNSNYKVTIHPDDLLVEAQFSLDPFSPWLYLLICACLLVLLAVGVAAVIWFLRSRRKPQ